MELRPSDYMRVLDAQGRSQGQSGRREAERLHRESGSSLDFNTWMSINRPVMNNGQMYIASDPEHATIMNHISTGTRQPLNLGTGTTTAPFIPIWEGATQGDTEMSQWMSSGSNLDFGDWLSAGKPEAFDMTPPPAPSNLNVPISKEPPVDFNSMSGPELTAYLKQQHPEQNFSKSSSSDQPDYSSMTGPEMKAYFKKKYPEQNFSTPAERIPISFDNRTVPITKELPAMFDNRQVPMTKPAPPMQSQPVSTQDKSVQKMPRQNELAVRKMNSQQSPMKDLAKQNNYLSKMQKDKSDTDKYQAKTDSIQAAIAKLQNRSM